MAREMNVSKRSDTLKTILAKTVRDGGRAEKIAKELRTSFKNSKDKSGKASALKLAKTAEKLSVNLKKVSKTIAV